MTDVQKKTAPAAADDAPSMLHAVVFFVVGVAMLVGVAAWARERVQFFGVAVAAPAVVVATPHGGSHPVVAFTPRGGARVEVSQGGMIGGWHVGDTARVLYDPAEPALSATLDTFGARWGALLMVGLMGAVFAGSGGWSLAHRGRPPPGTYWR